MVLHFVWAKIQLIGLIAFAVVVVYQAYSIQYASLGHIGYEEQIPYYPAPDQPLNTNKYIQQPKAVPVSANDKVETEDEDEEETTSRQPTKQEEAPSNGPQEDAVPKEKDLSSKRGPLAPRVYDLYDQMFSTEFPPQFLMHNLAQQCGRTEFHPNFYLHCGEIVAGLTTIMSQTKTCVRMAIELGYNLIVPRLILRKSELLTEYNFFNESAHLPFGEWFEEYHFIAALGLGCSQMKIIQLKEDRMPDLDIDQKVFFDLNWLPSYSGLGKYGWTGSDWTIPFHAKVLKEIDRMKEEDTSAASDSKAASSTDEITLVSVPARLAFFAVTEDPTGHDLRVWTELNNLFRTLPPIRKAVSIIAEALSVGPYYGIHHRAEYDWPANWMNASEQTTNTLAVVEEIRESYSHTGDKIAYVACGQESAIEELWTRGRDVGWTMIDKFALASQDGDLKEIMDRLPFDHLAMIDLGVLMVSDFYIGVTTSAFSWTVAHNRDPTGRYRGSSLIRMKWSPNAKRAASHLLFLGEPGYQCCL